jgi:pyridoxal 5'-phosphate synthase pdxT subunit
VEILGAVVPPGLAEAKIIAVRHENIMATSFHPEVTDDLRIHRYFVELVRAAQ